MFTPPLPEGDMPSNYCNVLYHSSKKRKVPLLFVEQLIVHMNNDLQVAFRIVHGLNVAILR